MENSAMVSICIVLKLFNSLKNFQNSQGPHISSARVVMNHGIFGPTVWSEKELSANAIQAANQHRVGEDLTGQKARSKGLNPRLGPEI